MVGSLSTERELMYGHIFSKYLADPANLFVISSDFCHWGMYISILVFQVCRAYNKNVCDILKMLCHYVMMM